MQKDRRPSRHAEGRAGKKHTPVTLHVRSGHPRAAGAPPASSGNGVASTPGATPTRRPGDDAVPGTVGTGEDVCQRCNGSGQLNGNQPCPDCEGTGVVIQGIGGG